MLCTLYERLGVAKQKIGGGERKDWGWRNKRLGVAKEKIGGGETKDWGWREKILYFWATVHMDYTRGGATSLNLPGCVRTKVMDMGSFSV